MTLPRVAVATPLTGPVTTWTETPQTETIVLRPGSDAALRVQHARMAHELAAARRILEAAT